MAATLRIDTLKFVRKLTDAGMERPLAGALVEGISDADTSELATKAENISELKADLTRLMMLQVVATVGLGVTLIKLLP